MVWILFLLNLICLLFVPLLLLTLYKVLEYLILNDASFILYQVPFRLFVK